MVDKASIIREAQKYLSKGQIDKAIVEWEKLLKESPDGATFNTVGDLHLKKGNKQSAIDAFHKASKIFKDEGFSLKALALYKKILNINPADGDALFALGELNEEKNIVTDAIKYYLAATDIYSKENKKTKLVSAYDKILRLAPTNIPLRLKISELFSKEGFVAESSREYLEIGKIYAEQGETDNAKRYFQKSLEIQPRNTDAMLAMSNLAEKLGNFQQAVGYMKNLMSLTGEETTEMLLRVADLLIKSGSLEEATTYISKVVGAEPSNLYAKRLLGDVYVKQNDMAKAWQEYSSVLDEMIFKENYSEAINVLNMFKEIDPIESRRKLVSLYKQINDTDSAVMEISALAEIFEGSGMQADALKCYQEALSLLPGSSELKEKIEAIEKELGIEVTAPEKTIEESLTEADIFLRYGLYDEAKTLLEGLKVKIPENIDIHLKLKSLYLDTADKEQTVTECLILAELYGRNHEEDKKQSVLSEAYEINPDDPRLVERIAPAKEEVSPPLASTLPSMENYSEELSEADFYAKQGLIQDAVEIYRKLINIFPENEELRGRLSSIEGEIQEERVSLEEEKIEPISLEELIVPEIEPEETQEVKEPELESDVLEIFEEFKRGLAKDLEAEDYETHYNLGIAYKEMGLVDDAINEFQIAKRDPKFFIQAASTLGMCYVQKGLYSLAIDALSSAIMKVAAKDESHWALKYDLADAYEKDGKLKEAFQLYTEVYGWNSKFRDVTEKINLLKGVHVKAAEFTLPEEKKAEPEKPKKSRVSYI
ncbi:MAG: tetratricopeptide repeat protein [Nitrospirae bacterium]|nr:tetratricopeptide repeat protein [Nitrospirota bacterium]